MSCFIDFLRFIFCCRLGEDEQYEPINRNYKTYERSYASRPTISTPIIKQSNAYTSAYSPIQMPKKSTTSSVGTQETRTKASTISTPFIKQSNAYISAYSPIQMPEKPTTSSVGTQETRTKASTISTPFIKQSNAYTSAYSPIQIPEKSTTSSVGTQETRTKASTISTPFIKQSNAYTSAYSPIQMPEKSTTSSVGTLETRTKASTISTPFIKQSNAYTSAHSPIQMPEKSTTSSVGTQETRTKASTISTPFIKQSNAYTSAYFPIQMPEKLNTSSVGTQETRTKTSIPTTTNLRQKLNASSDTPNVRAKSAVQYESTIKKLSESASEFSQPASSSSHKSPRPSFKPTIMSLTPSASTNRQGKTNYVLVQKDASPTYAIPEDLKILFTSDVVPPILKKAITPSTYKEYFQTLLYAEDFYIEKWNGFEMKDVTLKLHEAAIYKRGGNRNLNDERDEKVFVEFKLDSVSERRPFILSRDFVTVRPTGKESASFQGIIYRVVKSNIVLVEFEEDFHWQHKLECKYDVQFSFNRVCLKRAHQAISAASDPLFQNFLFPDSIPKITTSSIPYIIEGPLSVEKPTSTSRDTVHETVLSKTGKIIRDIVLKSYHTCPSCHILICAPTNKTCDVITRSLQDDISDIFRANAAFRELDGVPLEIVPNCRYKKEVFSCPPLRELRQLKVVVSTFMSAFRLHNEGIAAGHFSHIFLVDTSLTTEPEAMVVLANLADDETVVVVSGKLGNRTGWVRSNIARRYGLMVSFFERIHKCDLYQNPDSRFITQLKDSEQ